MAATDARSRISGFRTFCGVALLNALLAFPVLYALYKHYDDAQTPMDTVAFMAMAEEGPTAAASPIRYRLLTPLIVKGIHVLPGYGIPIDYTLDPQAQKTFFHFLILNFLFTIAASALLYLWLRRFVNPLPAWAGSLLYLFSFYAVTVNLIPMSDAACHLAIIAAILCLERTGLSARLTFAIVSILGALSKEAFFLVIIPWVALRAVGNPREARALLWLLPAFAAFAAMVIWMPQGAGAVAGLGAAGDVYLGSEANARVQEGWDTWRVFYAATYDRSFVFHTLLANLPLFAALAGWGWLRTKGVRVPPGRALALIPLLLVFGIALGLGNNAARLAFMAFPAIALFQTRVLEAFVREG